MTIHTTDEAFAAAQWLFAIGNGDLPVTEGLIAVEGFDPAGQLPEVVAVIERAQSYGARAVLFEARRHSRAPVAQAFVFNQQDHRDDAEFAELHKRLWSWAGVPLVYRAGPGLIQLFRCVHKPDFIGDDDIPIINPIRTLKIGADIAAQEIWWDLDRIHNGAIWDDPDACDLMLSASKSAHRKLVAGVRTLAIQLSNSELLDAGVRRRLLILSLLIAYLEERLVLLPEDFAAVLPGAERFFEVLANGPALVKLLEALEERFNGHVFRLTDEDRAILSESLELGRYARLIQGYEDENGQISFWRLYSFRDLPVELISNIYQLFVKDASSSIYTPPALVRLMLEEVLDWDRIDKLMAGDGVILDPACGSGVFLVEAYKRLVLHWRSRNGWARPNVEVLRKLLVRVHGIDLEDAAVELAAFSLCLSLCDALEPIEIRASIKLFPRLAGATLHHSCFFDAKHQALVRSPVLIVIGNPPFESVLTTEGAKRSAAAYAKKHDQLADNQLAYLFLHDAMEMLAQNGILAMVEPAGFLYNQNALGFRQSFLKRWRVRELLDFVSVRGMFKKGNADPKIVVVITEASKPEPESRILHAVFRRNGRATAEQGFDIDYYDLHWIRNADAEQSRDVWRANLLGGNRARDLIERLRTYPTLEAHARRNGWDAGEGYLGGEKNASSNVAHLIGHPLLPTSALNANGIDRNAITVVPKKGIKDPKFESRFKSPLLLVKEHQDLHLDVWTDGYLVFKNEIVGFSAPGQVKALHAAADWLAKERTILQAYVAGISSRLYTQRATAIFSADILALPFPADGDLDVSANERIVAEDIVEYQRDFIRLGADAKIMQKVPEAALASFDEVLTAQLGQVYGRKPLRPLSAYQWAGAVCKAYAFGNGTVDWSGAEELRERLDALLRERRKSGLTITRIVRLYDKEFLFLLKPDRHRFWTRSIALRDADDVLTDLRAQGF
ncbi:MAG: class I SAM-dependent DNA methyltransferase [Sphingomonadaceae bacterium]